MSSRAKAKAKPKPKPKAKTKTKPKPAPKTKTQKKIKTTARKTGKPIKQKDPIVLSTFFNFLLHFDESKLQEILESKRLKAIQFIIDEKKTDEEALRKKSATSKGSSKKRDDNKATPSERTSRCLENLLEPGVRTISSSERNRWKRFICVESNRSEIAVKECIKLVEIFFITCIFNFGHDIRILNSFGTKVKTYMQPNDLEVIMKSYSKRYAPYRFILSHAPKRVLQKKLTHSAEDEDTEVSNPK